MTDPEAPLFEVFDQVRVRLTPRTVDKKIAGKLGAILGISVKEPGSVSGHSYAVHVDGASRARQINEQELESTGKRYQRSDFYTGESIRVTRRGELSESTD